MKNSITIIFNNVNQYVKEHPFIKITSIVIGIVGGLILIYKFIFWEVPKHQKETDLTLHSEKIYLCLWETGREVALNKDNITVPPVMPIKSGEPITFREVEGDVFKIRIRPVPKD